MSRRVHQSLLRTGICVTLAQDFVTMIVSFRSTTFGCEAAERNLRRTATRWNVDTARRIIIAAEGCSRPSSVRPSVGSGAVFFGGACACALRLD